ncbi:MAG TPA: TetR/AcrR family transcriptional regulator [Acidimicrobiales bacterium]
MATTQGRPRSFDRAAALDRATHLFWERGYEGTSIADLTEAMGIHPPSLYAAFSDKRTLFEEVVERYGATFGAFMDAALREEPTAYAAFARMLREAADEYTDPGHPPGCLIISAATNVPAAHRDVQDALCRLRNRNLERFEARLRAAVADGELPADADPRALAVFYAAVIQGMSQQARDGVGRAQLRAVAELALSTWPGTPSPAPKQR